ncbi:hypothetical protein BKA66DRAFT_440019 [Pyrenochaeta sp. MPI-SDFR-AT-0127]|nr:hypothetical protein BKA66DRAFT_440019 [Pyrenochaeta sp. MPI-SDFR-AT-0127]
MVHVYRTGLTELHPGTNLHDGQPTVSIVFIHGLGGHPVRTWSAATTCQGTDASDRRPSNSSDSSTPRDSSAIRKGSLWGKFKRSKTGSLGDRNAPAASVSPEESTIGPLTEEPENIDTPMLSPRAPISNPLSRTTSSAVVPLAIPSPSKKLQIYWPRDFLPSDIPDARIFTYGYDADVVKNPFSKGAEANADTGTEETIVPKGKLNFTQHAHDLMVTLNRELPNNVPVILCAHSLGGVLAKRALCESRTHTKDPLKQKLSSLTKAVFFFGTPHKGSSSASWGEMGTKIVSLMNIEVTSHLVKNLKLDSEVLDIIHSDFMRLIAEGKFWVHTFQEARAINNVIGKVVEDYSSKIDETPLQQYEKIDGNHRTMIQFKNQQEHGYRRILSALKYYMMMFDAKYDLERRSIASAHSAKSIQSPTIHVLPYEKNDGFVGRVETLESINMLFAGPKFTPFVALHGLGGIGKTQVAIELAQRWKKFFPSYSIFWVHATKADVFDKGLQTIAEELGIPPSAGTNVRNLVQKWLEDPANGKWLLIIDNVDDKTVLDVNNGKGRFKLLPCIPKTGHGHVLFTTRYKSVAMDLARDHVRLDPLSKLEGLDLLKTIFADDWDDRQNEDAQILLEELSYIPLAIVHAACYMRENTTSIVRYLKLYNESEESRQELLEEDIVGLGEADNETPKTVLNTTWMSLNRLKADGASGPLAIEFLSIMALLHRQDIPIWLLEKFRPKAGSIKIDKALGTLKGYNLVTENTKTETLTMHRLVQLSMRRWLQQEGREGQTEMFRETAFKLISDNFPDGYGVDMPFAYRTSLTDSSSFKTWEVCKTLIIHTDTVLENSATSEQSFARAKLLENSANFQIGGGQYVAAEKKLHELIKLKTGFAGPENAETLRAQDQLAWCLRSQAKKDHALQLAQKTLLKKESLFGKTSAEVLTTAHIVATVIGDQGKHQEASVLHQANFNARKNLLGLEHLDTLRSAASLSLEFWELGKFVEAEDLARDTLAIRTRLLGDEHPDTLEIAGTLGFILEIQGRYLEAKELKENMLNVRERIYGDDHPDTADSLHDMGWILHQMGRYEEADPYYQRSLAAKQRLLGDEHWKTLTTMCNYPVFFTDMGRYDEAEIRSKTLIEIFKRVQGEEHPQTLDATGGLAVILRHLGKLDEAAAAARTSIDGRNRVLGPDHPWTLPPISHWGYVLTLQGQYERGEEVIRNTLRKMENHMGPESANVLTSVVFLSKNLYLQAVSVQPPDSAHPKLKEAEQLAQRAILSRTRLLGEDHPYRYKTMHHLAKVIFARGRCEEAIEIARRGLGGLRRVLGGELGVEHADVSRADIELREMEEKQAEGSNKELGVESKAGEDEVEVVEI